MTREEFETKNWKIGQTVYFLSTVVKEYEVTEINTTETKKGKIVTCIYIDSKEGLGLYVSHNGWCESLFSNKKKAKRAQVFIQQKLKNGLR